MDTPGLRAGHSEVGKSRKRGHKEHPAKKPGEEANGLECHLRRGILSPKLRCLVFSRVDSVERQR